MRVQNSEIFQIFFFQNFFLENLNPFQPLVDDYNRQQLPKVEWLDRLVFREIEQINEEEKQCGYLLHLLIETQVRLSDQILNDFCALKMKVTVQK